MLLVGQNSRFLLGGAFQNSAAQRRVILRFGSRIRRIGVRIIAKRLVLRVGYIVRVLGRRRQVIVIILPKQFELTHFGLKFLFPWRTARVSVPIIFLRLNKRPDMLFSLVFDLFLMLYTPQLLIKIIAFSRDVLILENLFLLVNFPRHLLVHDAVGR